jgi:hypothetical protein
MDVAVLIGTQQRAHADSREAVLAFANGRHRVWQWGWRKMKKNKKGHKLGAPHIHKALAIAEEVHKLLAPGDERAFLAEVLEYMNHETNGMKTTDEIFPFIKIRDIKAKGEGKGKGAKRASAAGAGSSQGGSPAMEGDERQEQPARVVINLSFGVLHEVETTKGPVKLKGAQLAAHLRAIVVEALRSQGAEVCSGMAPPGALERVVQRDLMKLQSDRRRR